MKKSLLAVLLLLMLGCGMNETKFPSEQPIIGLASPIQLNMDSTRIYLGDYFTEPATIDSVFIAGKRLDLADNKYSILYIPPRDHRPLLEMQVFVHGFPYSIIVKRSKKTTFVYSFDPGNQPYKTVQLAGEFNGWTPSRTSLDFKDNTWTVTMNLNPGNYPYRLVLDGKWIVDPANPDSIDNNMGGFNSVLKVGEIEKNKTPFLYTKEVEKGEVNVGIVNDADEYFVYWQNFRLDPSFLELEKNELGINIPREARNIQRSFLRVYSYNRYGMSDDILIPLEFGEALTDPGKVTRFDREADIMYNVFVDRFYDGDPANDEPLKDPEVLPKANYFGGDIEGIIKKLQEGYFKELGINTLWISPVVKNPKGAYGLWPDPRTKFSAYHGYWPISFTQIDDRYGTSQEFTEMVTDAHDLGINVLLDLVAHHVHQDHPIYKQHPDWFTSLYLPDGSLNTERWDEYRLTTWFDVFLPTLDLSKQAPAEMLSDSAVWWIRNYKLDGFRQDACKHIPEYFWRMLTAKLKKDVVLTENRPVFQIGETYGSPELISSYVGSGMLDGQFDFNVYDAAIGVFARDADPFTHLNNKLLESFDYYGSHSVMGYITGNQDRARFISYAGGDLGFQENAKAAGWKRNVGVGNPVGYKKLSALTAFNMTIPGIPVIYYGDEIGMPGGNDPDSRRMMRFDNLSTDEMATKQTVEKLTKLRRNNLSLIYGDFYVLKVNDKTYAFLRKYFDHVSIVVFNKSNDTADMLVNLPDWVNMDNLKSNFGNVFQVNGQLLHISVPGNAFEVLTN